MNNDFAGEIEAGGGLDTVRRSVGGYRAATRDDGLTEGVGGDGRLLVGPVSLPGCVSSWILGYLLGGPQGNAGTE